MPPRFYINKAIDTGQVIELPCDTRHYATRVLRLKTHDKIILFNGMGGEFSANIINIKKSNIKILIDQHHDSEFESPLNIELAQAICTNEKMDWIIQKAVELGVTRIQPISTNRSVVRLSAERVEKRLRHWEKTIVSACEQCGRNHLPPVLSVLSLADWLSNKKTEQGDQQFNFMLSPTTEKTLSNYPRPASDAKILLAVGPEGGFTSEEEKNFLHTGFTPVRLGQRILRTETAAMAAVAAMQTLWGDF
ncbi:MAG: 16S rRNA (uracil(1498)-N(3))-methyltransferase [Betaproteobacteria bacterium]|nr:16S rRNA (uracil(1498)-N(3))-methyltransferase [Betaproteobacteria bacterium]